MGLYRLKFWLSSTGERPVRDWILSLSVDEKRKVDKLLKLLEAFGTSLRLPNGKPLGGGLYELRDDSKGPGLRISFERVENVVLVLLVGGDKSSQARDIDTARSRMMRGEERDGG